MVNGSYNGFNGKAPLIEPVPGSEGEDRFVIIKPERYSNASYYKNMDADKVDPIYREDIFETSKAVEFTKKLYEAWNQSEYGPKESTDLLGKLGPYIDQGWRLPYKEELKILLDYPKMIYDFSEEEYYKAIDIPYAITTEFDPYPSYIYDDFETYSIGDPSHDFFKLIMFKDC